jgi:hypothetical protein
MDEDELSENACAALFNVFCTHAISKKNAIGHNHAASSHQFALENHVSRLHVYLVEFSERSRAILDDVRYRINGGFKVNIPLLCHIGWH